MIVSKVHLTVIIVTDSTSQVEIDIDLPLVRLDVAIDLCDGAIDIWLSSCGKAKPRLVDD